MMYSYHSLPDLQKSLSEHEHESDNPPPQMRDYICWKDARYIFYLLFILMLILFLVFITFIITIYISK